MQERKKILRERYYKYVSLNHCFLIYLNDKEYYCDKCKEKRLKNEEFFLLYDIYGENKYYCFGCFIDKTIKINL